MEPVLAELDSVSKSYAGIPVLKRVNFSVRAGKFMRCWGGMARANPRL